MAYQAAEIEEMLLRCGTLFISVEAFHLVINSLGVCMRAKITVQAGEVNMI
jgi:hypothetical protein